MATPAIRMFRKLEGLFCVYKPAGVHWKLVRDSIETNLLKGECSLFFTGILWSCYHSPMRAVKLRHDAANTQHAFNLTPECPVRVLRLRFECCAFPATSSRGSTLSTTQT